MRFCGGIRFRGSRAAGGTGHTCCGQTRLWLLRSVPAEVGLRVDVNVTAGRARALLINRGTCPSPPSSCVGLCSLTRLVAYDPYTRASQHLPYGSVLSAMVGVGEAAVADWLVGVQALDEGSSVEVSLQLSSIARTKMVSNYTCDRMAHFCPQQQQKENMTGYTAGSAGTPEGPNGGGAMSAASASAAPGWVAWLAALATGIATVNHQRRCTRERRV